MIKLIAGEFTLDAAKGDAPSREPQFPTTCRQQFRMAQL
jgi:hypothetical protein